MNTSIVPVKKTVNERTASKIIQDVDSGWDTPRIPWSEDTERAVIGAILVNPLAFYDVASLPLQAEDFFLVRHNRIFKAIEEIEKAGSLEKMDYVVICQQLKDMGWLSEIGGAAYITELSTKAPDSTNAKVYGGLVQRDAIRRRIMGAAREIFFDAMDTRKELEAVVQTANEQLFIATEQTINEAESDIQNIISDYWQNLDAIRMSGELSQGLPSGFNNLDLLVHLFRGEVAILGGMAGMGKTQILIEIARFVASQLKLRVVFFSREMSQQQLMHRFVSIETGIPVDLLKEPARLSESDWSKFVAAAGNIHKNWKLNIVPYGHLTPMGLRRHLKKMQREYAVELVLIDGLWLLDADAPYDKKDRKEQIGHILKEINLIAADTQVRCLMTHQLNRDAIGRKDHRPVMSDFSESSSVEKDAHILMALYRESYPSFQTVSFTPDKTEIHVLKNRDSGSTGVAELRWTNGRYTDWKVQP